MYGIFMQSIASFSIWAKCQAITTMRSCGASFVKDDDGFVNKQCSNCTFVQFAKCKTLFAKQIIHKLTIISIMYCRRK